MDEAEEKATDSSQHDPADEEATIAPGARTQPRERIAEAIPVEKGENRLGPYRILEEIGRGGMGIAAEMERMGLFPAVVELYERIAETSGIPEVEGAALLGRADALAAERKLAEACAAYEKASSFASVQGPAFLGAAKSLEALHRWRDLREHLRLERFSLSQIQDFPPRFPRPAEFDLIYSREKHRCWTEAEASGEVKSMDLDFTLHPGTCLFGIRAGNVLARDFWCRLRIASLSLEGSSTLASKWVDETSDTSNRLALAGGFLVRGEWEEAIDGYDEILSAETPLEEGGRALLEVPSYFPNLASRARLYRGFARHRSGKRQEAIADVSSALSEEPVKVLDLLFPVSRHFPENEKRLLALALERCLEDSASGFLSRFLPALGTCPDLVSRSGLSLADIGTRWSQARRADDPATFRRMLAGLLSRMFDARFAAILFAGTDLEASLRSAWYDRVAAVGASFGQSYYAREAYRDLLQEDPDNARLLNDFAWYLVTVPLLKMRDPAKAATLAARAVTLAGESERTDELPMYLVTLAAAQRACGEAEAALETRKKAFSLLGPGEDSLRAKLEKRLDRYERAAK